MSDEKQRRLLLSLSLSSILLSSPPQHPRLFSSPQLPTHSLLKLTLTHTQDPRPPSLPPLVVPINSGCGTPALRHGDPIRSGLCFSLAYILWVGLSASERESTKGEESHCFPFPPPSPEPALQRMRMTSGAVADALVLEVLNTFFWNIPFHAKKGFLLSRPAPHPSAPTLCARPPPAQTRALSGLPGVPPSITSGPERKCWCYTILIEFPSMHSSLRQSGVIKGGTDYSGPGSCWTTAGVTKKGRLRERDKEIWGKRGTLDWKIEQNESQLGSECGREEMTIKKWERESGALLQLFTGLWVSRVRFLQSTHVFIWLICQRSW